MTHYFLSLFSLATFFHANVPAKNDDLIRDMEEIWQMPKKEVFLNISHRLASLTRAQECKKALQSQKREIYLFRYPSTGHLPMKGYVSFVPAHKATAPVLFFLRGGNRYFGLQDPANRFSCYGPYTVIGLTYRGSVSPGQDQFGGNDVDDVKNLIEFFPKLVSRLGLATDSHRYLLGISRGSLQMFLALNRFPTLATQFKAVMSVTGVLDLASWIGERPEMADMFRSDFGMTDKNQEAWVAHRNPITNVQNIPRTLSIIIVQASDDDRVQTSQGKSMTTALIKRGFSLVTYREIVKAGHSLYNLPETPGVIWQLLGEERRPSR